MSLAPSPPPKLPLGLQLAAELLLSFSAAGAERGRHMDLKLARGQRGGLGTFPLVREKWLKLTFRKINVSL